ncbi:hypothetical protein ACM55I_10295 [Flavobacterium sp. GB2R13]|uniref:hypothetical protein n=1 Tax=Flavobacterium algoris TaxID=3398733 RepID=UPI003A8B8F22
MQFSKTNYRVFSIILFGFLLFGLKEFAELLYHPLQSTIAFIGLLFIFVSPFYFRYKRVNLLKGKIRIVFNAYLWWTFLIIIRPFFLGQDYSEDSLHPYKIYGLTSYLLPFIVLLGTSIISLPKLFNIIFVFSFIGYIFFVLNFSAMQAVVFSGVTWNTDGEIGLAMLANQYYYWFSISSLSLLCYEFVPRKYRWVAIFSSLFMMFLMTYFARRSGIFMFALYFLGMFYLYLEQSKSKNRIVKFVFIFALISIVFILVQNNSNSIFSILLNRINEDTRSGVDMELIKNLTAENAWLFGKGIEGTYKSSFFDEPRYTHESGWLYFILKGGIIYLVFYVYLLLHAAYIGFFKTRNRFTKALALFMFFHVVFLIPYGLPSFGLEYFFVWISFAICESSNWRLITNEQVKFYFTKT